MEKGVFGYPSGEVWVMACAPRWRPFCRQHRGVVCDSQGESLSLMKSPSSSPEYWLVGHWQTRCAKGFSLISLSLPLCPLWTGCPHLTTSRLPLSAFLILSALYSPVLSVSWFFCLSFLLKLLFLFNFLEIPQGCSRWQKLILFKHFCKFSTFYLR